MPMVSMAHPVDGQEIRPGERHFHGYESAVNGSIPFHAVEAIDHRDSPIGPHMEGQDGHVVVHGVVRTR